MNAQIEDLISRCSICQTHRNNQQKEPMMSTEVPTLPWQIVSADLFQFNDEHYIAVVDHYSGYLEVEKLMGLTTFSVIKELKSIFSTHGIPFKFYHDPGTQFTSIEFRNFSKL